MRFGMADGCRYFEPTDEYVADEICEILEEDDDLIYLN